MLHRAVKVRRKSDHDAVSFSYVSPRMAQLSVALLGILFFLVLLCFASDIFDSLFGQRSPLHLAARLLGPIYLAYDLFTKAIKNIVSPFVGVSLLPFISHLLSFFVLASFAKYASYNLLAPTIFRPLLGSSATICFYKDKINIGSQSFTHGGNWENIRFQIADSERTRNGLSRTIFHELSCQIILWHGAKPVSIATVFSPVRASNIVNALGLIQDFYREMRPFG